MFVMFRDGVTKLYYHKHAIVTNVYFYLVNRQSWILTIETVSMATLYYAYFLSKGYLLFNNYIYHLKEEIHQHHSYLVYLWAFDPSSYLNSLVFRPLGTQVCGINAEYKGDICINLIMLSMETRVVVEAGTSETKTETETWVAETKTETEAI